MHFIYMSFGIFLFDDTQTPPLGQFSPETVDSGVNETRGPLVSFSPAAHNLSDKKEGARLRRFKLLASRS